MPKITSVESYFLKQEKFSSVLNKLRSIILKTELSETLKWSVPTYTYMRKNLVGLAAFKNHVSLWFFQGALLRDSEMVLHNAQKGKTKAMRQIRFVNLGDINEKIISDYLNEMLDNQRKGLEIKPVKHTKPVILPKELKNLLIKNSLLKTKFDTLTPGKKREYISFINEVKKDATKLKRLEKTIPLILEGKGLYDKYKNC